MYFLVCPLASRAHSRWLASVKLTSAYWQGDFLSKHPPLDDVKVFSSQSLTWSQLWVVGTVTCPAGDTEAGRGTVPAFEESAVLLERKHKYIRWISESYKIRHDQMPNGIHPNGVGEVNRSPRMGFLWVSERESITVWRSFPWLCPLRQGEERLGVMLARALGRGGREGLRRGVRPKFLSSPKVSRQCACKIMACLKSEYDIESFRDDQTLKNISPLLRSSINVLRKPGSSYLWLYPRICPVLFHS